MAVDAKICGLTRPVDAALAVSLGASRLGVVYAGGPRVVNNEQARGIVAAAGAVPVLGVFGAIPVGQILATVRAAGLRGVQMHGDFDPVVARHLRAEGLEVWRVLMVGQDPHRSTVTPADLSDVDALLIEPRSAAGVGGQGIALPLERARDVRRAHSTTRVVLAGGLTAESVGAAIRVVGPDAVDVSSGVESAPGIKDPVRLARFLEAVRVAGSTA